MVSINFSYQIIIIIIISKRLESTGFYYPEKKKKSAEMDFWNEVYIEVVLYFFVRKRRKIYCYCSTGSSQNDWWIVLITDNWKESLFWLSKANKAKSTVDLILKAKVCQSSKAAEYRETWIWKNIFLIRMWKIFFKTFSGAITRQHKISSNSKFGEEN